MAAYLAQRIIDKAFGDDSYTYVVSRKPLLKDAIDQCLIESGNGNLIIS